MFRNLPPSVFQARKDRRVGLLDCSSSLRWIDQLGIRWLVLIVLGICSRGLNAETIHNSVISTNGWSANSVNTTSFRYQSVTSRNGWQFVAFYDSQQRVVLAKRQLGTDNWQVQVTSFTGSATDAHNGINLGIDANGYLHMAWNMHNSSLWGRYAVSTEPYSLNMTLRSMVGTRESSMTYPQFYNLPNGQMLFMYRDGSSGNGNLVINRYNPATARWTRVTSNLLNGEGVRNAYWQATVDANGRLHLSWVWRESSDASTNHDMGYAYSDDGGVTWKKINGSTYTIPITAATTDYAWLIPQGSDLINQTSMAADIYSRPYIVTYFNDANTGGVPQLQLIYWDGSQWRKQQIGQRTLDFTLAGGGTLRIPLSRPQIVVEQTPTPVVHVIFRDLERGGVVSLATCRDLASGQWEIRDIWNENVNMWEPTFDINLWMSRQELHLFLQNVEQLNNEGVAITDPTPVSILQWNPHALLGDTNSDGVVDLADYNNVVNNLGSSGPYVLGDTNSDGLVDLADYNNVVNNLGAISGSSLAVPEPVSLLSLSLTSLILRSRRSSP